MCIHCSSLYVTWILSSAKRLCTCCNETTVKALYNDHACPQPNCHYDLLLYTQDASCFAVLCHAIPCHAMLCHAMLCCVKLCHALLCCVMLWYAMLCYATLCCAELCYATPYYAELCCAAPGYAVQQQAMLVQAFVHSDAMHPNRVPSMVSQRPEYEGHIKTIFL